MYRTAIFEIVLATSIKSGIPAPVGPARFWKKELDSACVHKAGSVAPAYAKPIEVLNISLSRNPEGPGCLHEIVIGKSFGPCSVKIAPGARIIRVSAIAYTHSPSL